MMHICEESVVEHLFNVMLIYQSDILSDDIDNVEKQTASKYFYKSLSIGLHSCFFFLPVTIYTRNLVQWFTDVNWFLFPFRRNNKKNILDSRPYFLPPPPEKNYFDFCHFFFQ